MNSDVVDKKLNEYFSGRVVRKDLTQADVQVYIDADKKSTEVKVDEPLKPVFVAKTPDTKPADTKGTEGKAPVATDVKSGQPANTAIVK